MSRRDPVLVGLLSHYFEDDNLGCVALSVSNMILLDQAAEELGVSLEYRILVNEKHPHVDLSFTSNSVEYQVYSSSKQSAMHPLRLLRTSIFDDCDFVMNINAGDGFTDLYGFPRMISESYMSWLTLHKGVPLVIAPQTIGPFKRTISKAIAKSILRRSARVFSRDEQSTALSVELGVNGTLDEVIDVAFALPFERPIPTPGGPTRVGLNVSGLLYRGGYDGANYFNLAFDYRDFIGHLVSRLIEEGSEVHLISHVVAKPGSIEDDFSACEEVHRQFPTTVLAPRFEDAIAVKSYISGMDFFTGARMHSTIAAISSGVAVAPIGYSKKLPGLYDTLGYPYYIDARESQWTSELAIDQIVEWLRDVALLQNAVSDAEGVYTPRLAKYRSTLKSIISDTV